MSHLAHNITPTQLRHQWKPIEDSAREYTKVRMHRALSWLDRAQACDQNDLDIALLCRWTAFNALYGQWDMETKFPMPEKESWQTFADRILLLDKDEFVANVFRRHDRSLHEIVANKYLNSKRWADHEIQNGEQRDQTVIHYQQWRTNKTWQAIFDEVLDRTYLLRCQMVHGASTYNSKLNRPNVSKCNLVLKDLITAVCLVIINYGVDEDWGIMCYPPLHQT